MVPKQITTPIGFHRKSPLRIIGNTPKAVVQEVRKIGRIRRFPASSAASFNGIPRSKRSSSAYSNMIIPLRTMMPTKLISPRTAVSPKSSRNTHSPKNAPKKQSTLSTKVSIAIEIFLKWNSRKKNKTATAQMNAIMISGPTSLLMAESPAYSTLAPSGRFGLIWLSTKALICFIASGWLHSYFISAVTVRQDSPALRGYDSSSHPGCISATCRKGTETPGYRVGSK